jgi:hypothetical protein
MADAPEAVGQSEAAARIAELDTFVTEVCARARSTKAMCLRRAVALRCAASCLAVAEAGHLRHAEAIHEARRLSRRLAIGDPDEIDALIRHCAKLRAVGAGPVLR